MAKWTINTWNAQIDRSKTKRVFGKQGVLYEFEFYKGTDLSGNWWEKAANVKSIKNSTQYNNGKRPGQYQPIGDKRYFTYFQIKKMTPDQRQSWAETLSKRAEQDTLEAVDEAIEKVMFDG